MKTIYKIDPAHSSAQFTVRHMMITNVRGSFRTVNGTIELDREHPENSSVEAVIDVKTISTNDDQRDGHLKSPDFLDAEKFPEITFKSRKVSPAGSEKWKVTGELTMHGIAKEVTLEMEPPSAEGKDLRGSIRMGTSASTRIKRGDYGLTFNAALETGGVVLGDELKIDLEVSAVKSGGESA